MALSQYQAITTNTAMTILDITLIIVRLILAYTFYVEARHKFKDISAFAKQDQLPLPLAILVASAEAAASFAMLSGILATWAAIGLVILMIITIGFHLIKWHSPYSASKGGWEYDLLLLILALVIATLGPGQIVIPIITF